MASMLMSGWMMTRDHSWGDDFAAYLLQARSIVQGNMVEYVAQSTFTMDNSSHVFGPVTEPWGYPLMLAPTYAIFGLRVQALKAVGVVCYAAMLAAFFLLARTRVRDRESLLLTALLGFNVAMQSGTNEILSDIPFALWSTLCLWLMLRPEYPALSSRGRLLRQALLGTAIFAAVFTRVAGFVLFVPLVAVQIMQLRRRGRGTADLGWLLTPYAAFGALYGAQGLVFPSVEHAAPWGTVTLQSVWDNAVGYFWVPGYFLRNILFGAEALYLVLLPFFLLCVVHYWRRDLPLHLYIGATLGLFIVRQGMPEPRYLFPLWPLFLLFTYEGMLLASGRLKGALQSRARTLAWDAMLMLAILSFAACLQLGWLNARAGRYDWRESRGAFHPTSNRMFEFIRDKTPADSVIIFFKPRAMRLRTDRSAFFTTRCEDLPRGDYVAIEKSMGGYDQILPQDVMHCNPDVVLTPVFEKDQFVVYQIASLP